MNSRHIKDWNELSSLLGTLHKLYKVNKYEDEEQHNRLKFSFHLSYLTESIIIHIFFSSCLLEKFNLRQTFIRLRSCCRCRDTVS